MSGALKHRFQSTIADAGEVGMLGPDEWNDSLVASGGTNGDLFLRNTVAADGWSLLASAAAGQVLASGGAGSAPSWSTTPTFTSLTLSGLTANSFLYSGAAGALTTTAAPTNGQLLIGSTAAAPALGTITGTANRVTVTNGAGTITLSGPQDLATSSTVQFSSLGLGKAPANKVTVLPSAEGDGLFVREADDGFNAASLTGSNGGGKFQLLTGGTATVSFDATGAGSYNFVNTGANFGIGTATPSSMLHVVGGVQIGAAPTGGDKGAGTLNVSGDAYKNGTAYTNPDYVLEHWATGQIVRYADRDGAASYAGLRPLAAVEAFARSNYRLPVMAQKPDGGLFDRGDLLLASVEESYLYLFDHEHRLTAMHARIDDLETEVRALRARHEAN